MSRTERWTSGELDPVDDVNEEEIRRFERRLDKARPERVRGARVVGFGEISVVFALDRYPELVFKRVAGFRPNEVARYREVLTAYVRELDGRGVSALPVRFFEVPVQDRTVLYLAQRRVQPTSIGSHLLRSARDEALVSVLEAALAHVEAVLDPGEGPRLGLDAQLSNWSASGEGGETSLVYLDLTTPLLRDRGSERLELDFLLRSLPRPVRAAFELSGKKRSMLDRYYEPRSVAMDIVSNFIKEGREDRVELGVDVVNRWLERNREAAPLTVREVRADYRSDARTWAALQWVKRPDRFLRTRVMGRAYDWLIAPPIERHL